MHFGIYLDTSFSHYYNFVLYSEKHFAMSMIILLYSYLNVHIHFPHQGTMPNLSQPNAVPYPPSCTRNGAGNLSFLPPNNYMQAAALAGWYSMWATVVLQLPYCSTQQPRAFEAHLGKGQLTVPCCCVPGGHIQRPLWDTYHSALQRETTHSTSLTMYTPASVLKKYMVYYSEVHWLPRT